MPIYVSWHVADCQLLNFYILVLDVMKNGTYFLRCDHNADFPVKF